MVVIAGVNNAEPRPGGSGRSNDNHGIVTIDQMAKDNITEIACGYWAPYTKDHAPFDARIVAELYQKELLGSAFAIRRIVLLEFSQYLENFLWPNYDAAKSSLEHVMSIVIMLNEKFRERVPTWLAFIRQPQQFANFFRCVLDLALDEEEKLTLMEQSAVITFLVHCFNSLEVDLIRQQTAPLYSFNIWDNLLPSQREELFARGPKTLRKVWKKLKAIDAKMDAKKLEEAQFERTFLVRLIQKFLRVLDSIPAEGEVNISHVHYCERFVELLIDMESVMNIRRTFNSLLHSMHVLTHVKMSQLSQRSEGELFVELLRMLHFYARFEVDELTGEALSEQEMTKRHYDRVTSLQKATFKHFRESMRDFYLLNVASIDSRRILYKHFGELKKEQLYQIAEFLHMVPSEEDGEEKRRQCVHTIRREVLLDLLVSENERRPSQLTALNEAALFPTEQVVWDENVIPYEHYNGGSVLALNKLNLQFLTLHDYLLRNFNLFQMESTYAIRGDLEDAVFRMKPWRHESGADDAVVWGGWSRMALPLNTCSIVEVAKPRIGEKSPALVRADIGLTLPKRGDLRAEWETLRRHDACFLLTVRPDAPAGTRYDVRLPFKEQIRVAFVRGCTIDGMIGPDGKVIEEMGPDVEKPRMHGDHRTFRVWLDTNQYREDMQRTVDGEEDPYGTFNLVVRRDPKENNFKSVLDTIRQLMNAECVVPDWLHDTILGYGDPADAHYTKMANRIGTLDFNDTFLDLEHLRSCFPNAQLTFLDNDVDDAPPYRLTFKALEASPTKKKSKMDDEQIDVDGGGSENTTIVVQPYAIPNRGPYPLSEPRRNTIRFTPTQVEAIKSGMQPGLTMDLDSEILVGSKGQSRLLECSGLDDRILQVVGPPGTGKTDVAVQIISNIYHNWPEQRTIIVTHSNQALNQLFEKIMQLDIDERHLLRLGHGEESLETEKDFTRYGRVNFVLAQRLNLLSEVERLQKSLGVLGDVAYTCETAMHFFLYQIQVRWENFDAVAIRPFVGAEKHADPAVIAAHFPFTQFFANAPQPLFKGVTYLADLDIALGCWRHIRRLFEQMDEFRAFELMRSGRDRTEYLLVKEAKIIAMTCTHASLRREYMVDMAFRYDNILMEESAQILEIETFIPLLLQNAQDGHNRLKRWIMIGDHHQLPPVIQNMAYQKYSNMEQSLFARFIRLGVPAVQLDAQGRARSSIAALYNWRYRTLGNLPHVEKRDAFQRANAGFLFDYQLIDVADFNGKGETTPTPHFFQNLGEAEYAVAIFMYMRLLGYPAEKISLLTTYNGQKHLLHDVVEKRCAANPMIGRPFKISTVDKYQGQQNDYIILSLVRTRTVGHLRDVRRLVVALSRARLGMYVLGRVSLFRNCFELTPAFNLLCKRPQQLMLVPSERFPTQRLLNAGATDPVPMADMSQMAQLVYQLYTHNVKSMRTMYEQHMSEHVRAADEEKREREELIEAAAQQQPAIYTGDGGTVDVLEPISEERATAAKGKATTHDIEFEDLDDVEPQ